MFNYLNYSTTYKANGDFRVPKGTYACFSKIFNKIKNDNTDWSKPIHMIYTIYMCTDPNAVEQTHQSNLCILTKDQAIFHIKYLRFLHRFKYNLSYSMKESTMILQIDLDAIPAIHMFFLTYLRYMYEFPYNLYLTDAMRLREDPVFLRKLNYLDLISLCLSHEYNASSIHMFGYELHIKKPMTRKQIIQFLTTGDEVRMNNLYDSIADSYDDRMDYQNYDSIQDFLDNFEERKNNYYIPDLKKYFS